MSSKQTTNSQNQPPRPRNQLRLRILGLIVTLMFGVFVGVLVGEGLVRLAHPGFPGFRVPQVEHRTVPGLGFEMVPNQVAYSTASRVTINSAGFRGPEILPLASAGSPRVLCLGDSMTMGVSVEDDETYPAQIAQELRRRVPASRPEVINAGVQRYFTYQEIDLLKKHVNDWRPHVVTLAVYINDLGVRPTTEIIREYENEREQAASAFRNRLPLVYLLIKNSALVEFLKNTYIAFEASGSANNIVANALAGRIRDRDEPKWRGVELEFDTFAALARQHGFHPIILFVPTRKQVEGDFPQNLYPRRLLEYARGLGLQAIDPTDRFKDALRTGNDPYLPWDDHMSVTGNRIVAEVLATEIERSDWAQRTGSEPDR